MRIFILTGSAFWEDRQKTGHVLELGDGFFNALKPSLIQPSPRTSQAAVKLMLPALFPGLPP